ncbi:MAG: PRD domain-containing protein [Candidatus Pelethousia sp.]|nr:PRD domain-containing protein [Candidatus Pelethousia sp.]
MTLTTRQYELLNLALEGDGYKTMASLAERLGLSKRTIQRELEALTACLGEDGRLIEVKSGSGVRFCGGREQRMNLLKKMGGPEKLRPVFSQEERVAAILMRLLMEAQPQKIYSFTRNLGITDTTVGSDLNHCEKWLAENGVPLVRKPGVGIYVEADEWLRRRALVRLYYEQAESHKHKLDNMAPALNGIQDAFDSRKLFPPAFLGQIERLLDSIPELAGMIQNDRGRKALALHLYLLLLRVSQGAGIEEQDGVCTYAAAGSLANILICALEAHFSIRIPNGERFYLSSVLQSSQGLSGISDRESERQAARIAERMILRAQARTGVMIDPAAGFTEALQRHLVPTIARLSMGLDIRNPILEDVKAHYGELYDLAQECAKELVDELHTEVPDSEIGYLAVHLGVALEDSRSYSSRRCRAIICCPSGMVTAQLLALRIKREFSDIEVKDVVSTAKLDSAQLERDSIEMIISTVQLPQVDLPSVQVSPFLTDPEKDAVWQLLKACKSEPPKTSAGVQLSDLVTTLARTRTAIDTILQILSGLFLWEDGDLADMPGLIARIARHTAGTPEQTAAVRADLCEREKLGSTITPDGETMLLHCRTEGVSQAWLGIIRAKEDQPAGLPKLALVMLAQREAQKQTLETLGAISRALVEEPAFIKTLCRGDAQSCHHAVERILNTYYCEIINQ